MVVVTDITTRWRRPSKRRIHIDNPPPPVNIHTFRMHKMVSEMQQIRTAAYLTPFLFDKSAWLERTRKLFNTACDEYTKNTEDIDGLVFLLEEQLRIAKATQELAGDLRK